MVRKIEINSEHTLSDLTNVAQTVFPLVKKIFGPQATLQLELLKNWQEIVGEDIAKYSLPQKIYFRKNERTNGNLTISVPGGAFAMEIKQKERQIVEKVNTFLGYAAFNKITIIQSANQKNFLKEKKSIDKMKKNLVSEEEQNYITEQTEEIQNPKLKEILQRLGENIFNSTKNRR